MKHADDNELITVSWIFAYVSLFPQVIVSAECFGLTYSIASFGNK